MGEEENLGAAIAKCYNRQKPNEHKYENYADGLTRAEENGGEWRNRREWAEHNEVLQAKDTQVR